MKTLLAVLKISAGLEVPDQSSPLTHRLRLPRRKNNNNYDVLYSDSQLGEARQFFA